MCTAKSLAVLSRMLMIKAIPICLCATQAEIVPESILGYCNSIEIYEKLIQSVLYFMKIITIP